MRLIRQLQKKSIFAMTTNRSRRGFILMLVVGALAVLVILGLQFAEQSRVDVLGAVSTRDIGSTEDLAESGFEIALRILADDQNVNSVSNSMATPGWTSRWGYNADARIIPSGAAPNRSNPRNFLDSWQCMIWNNEPFNWSTLAYPFAFDGCNLANDQFLQRYPAPPSLMQDVWQLQPFARARKYRLQAGASYGLVQIGITPLDGGFNLNDVFNPGTTTERPGAHDSNLYGGTRTADPFASPDRRTLEYMLGRRPEYAYQHAEYSDAPGEYGPGFGDENTDDGRQFIANQPAGSVYRDNGVYNFRAFYEPSGRSQSRSDPFIPDYRSAWHCFGSVNQLNACEPTFFYNAGSAQPNRYNYEATRYVMWASNTGMSRRCWKNTNMNNPLSESLLGTYCGADDSYYREWYPSGRYNEDVTIPRQSGIFCATRDMLFHGFGFDLQNSRRAGLGAALHGDLSLYYTWRDQYYDNNIYVYKGAGVYGHPQPRSFQYHFLPAVAGGRFWTNLEAAWYFGGAPGYTTQLGIGTYAYYLTQNNWAHLGSSYDSIGMGSHWMPPTMHVWMPGFWNQGALGTAETTRGMTRDPGNMPPAKPAATYAYPMRKWNDDISNDSAHLLYNSVRLSIRAHGIQENWGVNGNPPTDNGRFYDAINVNVSNFNVIYGLLTPEKIPSMMDRTVVAPHLHWKARYSDEAAHRDISQGRIWGKMDFTTLEQPGTYSGREGSGESADDVWTDARYDLSLSPNSDRRDAALDTSTMMPRPDNVENWPDWFMQRNVEIPASKVPTSTETNPARLKYKPQHNGGDNGNSIPQVVFPEGRRTVEPRPAIAPTGPVIRTAPQPMLHPIHGLPNPDYLLLYPGTRSSFFWADQYRRYFPVIYGYRNLPVNLEGDNNAPGAPEGENKLCNTDIAVDSTMLPVSNAAPYDNATPFVPAINRDNAWRITRIGRKYQEIIADEIMDYQINPWWPNPCAIYNDVGVRLSQQPNQIILPSPRRQIPDYFAYFNRFWVRPALRYPQQEPYRAFTTTGPNGRVKNPVENCGIYPQAYQYFGQIRPLNQFKDQIMDFPYNTLEDQIGADWRYSTGIFNFMNETNMPKAPARNHPFKNWADFVAMLGHLVYRSPMPATNPPTATLPPSQTILRYSNSGVNAIVVVNNALAATPTPNAFFDGSHITDADSLQQSVVARAGFWPISANYGEYYDPQEPGPDKAQLYPRAISNLGFTNAELDEWRGRDAAGLRVEHNYISERAANDILVNLSNGKIPPIDFDGDGYTTMTSRDEILNRNSYTQTVTNQYWPGYPWHAPGEPQPSWLGAGRVDVQKRVLAGMAMNATRLEYGVHSVTNSNWRSVAPGDIIWGCVTSPIKFRSNTFRVTVITELTDSRYQNSYGCVRYSRVYSRVPGNPRTECNGQYTGKFILHEKRLMRGGVDPEMSWLGCE